MKHHKITDAHKNKFNEDVRKFYDEFIKKNDPFKEDEDILVTLVNRNIMSEEYKLSVKEAYVKGYEFHENFLKHTVTTRETSIYTSLKRNNLKLFWVKNPVTTSKTQKKVLSPKQECNLYASFYDTYQIRECNLDDFSRMRTISTHHQFQWVENLNHPIINLRH